MLVVIDVAKYTWQTKMCRWQISCSASSRQVTGFLYRKCFGINTLASGQIKLTASVCGSRSLMYKLSSPNQPQLQLNGRQQVMGRLPDFTPVIIKRSNARVILKNFDTNQIRGRKTGSVSLSQCQQWQGLKLTRFCCVPMDMR